jgi:hypothetical protein
LCDAAVLRWPYSIGPLYFRQQEPACSRPMKCGSSGRTFRLRCRMTTLRPGTPDLTGAHQFRSLKVGQARSALHSIGCFCCGHSQVECHLGREFGASSKREASSIHPREEGAVFADVLAEFSAVTCRTATRSEFSALRLPRPPAVKPSFSCLRPSGGRRGSFLPLLPPAALLLLSFHALRPVFDQTPFVQPLDRRSGHMTVSSSVILYRSGQGLCSSPSQKRERGACLLRGHFFSQIRRSPTGPGRSSRQLSARPYSQQNPRCICDRQTLNVYEIECRSLWRFEASDRESRHGLSLTNANPEGWRCLPEM